MWIVHHLTPYHEILSLPFVCVHVGVRARARAWSQFPISPSCGSWSSLWLTLNSLDPSFLTPTAGEKYTSILYIENDCTHLISKSTHCSQIYTESMKLAHTNANKIYQHVVMEECLCSSNIICWNSKLQCDGIRRESPHEWDSCPYKRDEFSHSFCHVRIQQESGSLQSRREFSLESDHARIVRSWTSRIVRNKFPSFTSHPVLWYCDSSSN